MKYLKPRILEIATLAIYTFLNWKVFSVYIFDRNFLLGATMGNVSQSFNLLALFLGLFLNAAIVLYWLRQDNKS